MRRWAPWLAIAAGVLLLALLGRGAEDSGTPLDPRSTGPLGARALVLLLEESGAEVAIRPQPQGDVAVLLADDLGDGQRDRIEAWVEAGGTLVVADPFSPFVPALGRSSSGLFTEEPDERIEPGCDLPALRAVGAIVVPNAAGYRVPEGATGCFLVGRNAYLVATARGRGSVVALGGGAPLVNSRLTEGDNAVLAVALMAPRPGTRVTVLEAGLAGSGNDSLTDLLPDRTTPVLWQLAAAFAFLVLWRARRLGQPVPEHQAVDLPGSELVLATGNLLQAARRRNEAGAMVRFHAARELGARFGVPPEDRDRLRTVLVERGLDPDLVREALGSEPVRDDLHLIDIGRATDALRNEAMHV